MKCRDVQRYLLERAPGLDVSLPSLYTQHLETCETCRREWLAIKGWSSLLRAKEDWTPPDGFFERLVETGLREKHRAALTDAVVRDLPWNAFSWRALLRTPLHLPRFAPAALGMLAIVILAGLWIYPQFNTIGRYDYVEGSLFADGSAAKGDPIPRGTHIQTAQNAESIVKLAGGTEVLIASMSRIVIDHNRRVEVERGKVYFDVAKGRDEFHVRVPQGEILVLGTSFSVEVNPQETKVTVWTGVVQIANGARALRLEPGFEGRIDSSQVARAAAQTSVQTSVQTSAQTQRWVSALRQKRSEEELKTYYPSLAPPEAAGKAGQ